MYHRKLQNQIDKLWLPPLRQPVRTHAVLLADSKCFNLQQQVKVNPESFIQFWCKSSATAENRLQYLQDNLESELNTLHNITLCVWVGTCNLTKREGDFIYLRSRDNSPVTKLISDFNISICQTIWESSCIFTIASLFNT